MRGMPVKLAGLTALLLFGFVACDDDNADDSADSGSASMDQLCKDKHTFLRLGTKRRLSCWEMPGGPTRCVWNRRMYG